jgi:hypothetical protein
MPQFNARREKRQASGSLAPAGRLGYSLGVAAANPRCEPSDLTANLKTARSPGLKLRRAPVIRADEVLE